jgi:RHS repeat-associated protein
MSWSQTNGYDRYGNRWVDLGGGTQSLYFTPSTNHITGWSYDNAGNLLNDAMHAYAYDGENKIRTVDSQSAYVYDGEGQRVRKLLGENLRLIYGIGRNLIAEFDSVSGALKKEYIYGESGLVATIEPTALNSNGTRYSTPDHLGSPRVLTNSSAGVVSRHDYMPFGEELGAGVGGRTVGMGFVVSDGLRRKFTSYERDGETGLDFAQARFYSSAQGRFTSIDPLLASAVPGNPQTFNRYSYVANSPINLIDPTGMYIACPQFTGDLGEWGRMLSSFSLTEQRVRGSQKRQIYNPLNDRTIKQEIRKIRKKAKPLRRGETPIPTTVVQIEGDLVQLRNATVRLPGVGVINVANGYVKPICSVILDQRGNIMINSALSVTEDTSPVNADAQAIYNMKNALTSTGIPKPQQLNGGFYDLQLRGFDPTQTPMDIQTNQDLYVKSGKTNLFMVEANKIRMEDATRSITFTPGRVRKF